MPLVFLLLKILCSKIKIVFSSKANEEVIRLCFYENNNHVFSKKYWTIGISLIIIFLVMVISTNKIKHARSIVHVLESCHKGALYIMSLQAHEQSFAWQPVLPMHTYLETSTKAKDHACEFLQLTHLSF